MEIVQWTISNGCPYDRWEETTAAAAAYAGQMAVLQWLGSGGACVEWAAAGGGHLDSLKWAIGCSLDYNRELLENAAASGSIAMVDWLAGLFKGAFKVCYTSCIMAAYKGDLAMLHHLLLMHNININNINATVEAGMAPQQRRQILVSPLVCDAAAAGGRYAMTKWLASEGCWWDSMTRLQVNLAAAHRQRSIEHTEEAKKKKYKRRWDTRIVLDCAYEEYIPSHVEDALVTKCAWWEGLMIGAVDHEQLAVLDWAHATGIPLEMATTTMVYRGRLDMLKWAQAKGRGYAVWDARTCAVAIYGGHLHVVQWLRDNGCRWDERSCDAAALTGQLQILRWLRSEGCPWRVKTFTLAARGGHVEVLEWLDAHGCPWSRGKALKEAAKEGHTWVVQWISDHS